MKIDKYTTYGYGFAALSYMLWGVLPLYWKALSTIPALEILVNRIFWSMIFIMGICVVIKNNTIFTYFKNLSNLRSLVVTASLISINWFIYIYAVNSGRTVEASLGYFINPLVCVLLGVFFLQERLTRIKKIALGFACIGIIILTLQYGRFPWIAFVLATSFGFYGLFKKKCAFDSLGSLLAETILLFPAVTGYMIYLSMTSHNHLFDFNHVSTIVLLLFGGVVTSVPLLLFSEGAKRIPLSSVGLLQYISPSLALVIGVLCFHEPFTIVHGISFLCIWLGLFFYTYSIIREMTLKPA